MFMESLTLKNMQFSFDFWMFTKNFTHRPFQIYLLDFICQLPEIWLTILLNCYSIYVAYLTTQKNNLLLPETK